MGQGSRPTDRPGQLYSTAPIFLVGEGGETLEVHCQQRVIDGVTYYVVAPKGHAANICRAMPLKRPASPWEA